MTKWILFFIFKIVIVQLHNYFLVEQGLNGARLLHCEIFIDLNCFQRRIAIRPAFAVVIAIEARSHKTQKVAHIKTRTFIEAVESVLRLPLQQPSPCGHRGSNQSAPIAR